MLPLRLLCNFFRMHIPCFRYGNGEFFCAYLWQLDKK
nr:MAG TPA: hypothetical protein [Caudoviricetes sp.]